MGKGGHETDEWKAKVDSAYQDWKYNDIHKNIKSYFTEINTRANLPGLFLIYPVYYTLQQHVEVESPVVYELAKLRDTVENEERQETQKVFVRDSNQNITFLGTKIEIPNEIADDEEVSCII